MNKNKHVEVASGSIQEVTPQKTKQGEVALQPTTDNNLKPQTTNQGEVFSESTPKDVITSQAIQKNEISLSGVENTTASTVKKAVLHKIVAVMNQKGGVGKTTISINLACCLATAGYSVLLLDLDPQAHSSIALGFDADSYQYAIHDIFINKISISEVILKTRIANLDLVPSHVRLDRAEQLLTPELFKESRLSKAIAKLNYDFIIIDCRPTLGTLTINALYACNFILVPCEMARFSLDGFSDIIDTIDHIKNTSEIEPESFMRIVLNKFDSRKKITNDWVFEQLEQYKPLMLSTKIRQNEMINQAHIAMEPIIHFKPNSPGAQDFHDLTKELLTIWQASEKS